MSARSPYSIVRTTRSAAARFGQGVDLSRAIARNACSVRSWAAKMFSQSRIVAPADGRPLGLPLCPGGQRCSGGGTLPPLPAPAAAGL